MTAARSTRRARRETADSRTVRRAADRGSMSVETVLLAPVILIFLTFLVGAGRLVEAQGEVNGAARDAARAASVQRSLAEAEAAAADTAAEVLDGECDAPATTLDGSRLEEGGHVRAEVSCDLDLGFLGFELTRRVTGVSVVPLEQFRRFE